jgi:predicted nucleic acid-binding protein
LLIAEESTRRLQALAAKDSAMPVWWASAVECISALARLERDGALNPAAMTLALQRLHKLSARWHEVDPSDEIRETAARFLRVHALRAADALQLAAAFAAAERRPASLEIVTLDERLANAARKEGFLVLDLTEAAYNQLWTRNQPQPRGTHRQHDIIDAQKL